MGCATHSGLSSKSPAPLEINPQVCAKTIPEPKYPAKATVVQPVTPEEQEATQTYFLWVQSILDWGRAGWARAQVAADSTVCKK